MPRRKRKTRLRPKTPSRIKKRTRRTGKPRSLHHPELWGLALVALGRIKNIQGHYKDLSTYSAIARREGWFPALLDRTRAIHVHRGFPGPGEARAWLSEVYRRDRTEGQSVAVYVGVEKAAR